MSCCKSKYKRQQDLQLVMILAEQFATVNNEVIVVVEMHHGVYGIYYDFVTKTESGNIKSSYYGKPILHQFGGTQLKKVSKSVGKKSVK